MHHQPESPLAGGEGIRVAQVNRPAAPGQATRTGKGGLAFRLQLRRAQPDPAAEANGSTSGKAQGAKKATSGISGRRTSGWIRKRASYTQSARWRLRFLMCICCPSYSMEGKRKSGVMEAIRVRRGDPVPFRPANCDDGYTKCAAALRRPIRSCSHRRTPMQKAPRTI